MLLQNRLPESLRVEVRPAAEGAVDAKRHPRVPADLRPLPDTGGHRRSGQVSSHNQDRCAWQMAWTAQTSM